MDVSKRRCGRSTPEGWHTITPRIVVYDTKQFIEFLKQVFAATGEYVQTRPAVIRIGDSVLMISEPEMRQVMTSFLCVYVDDVDATYERGLKGGARSLEEPFDTPYGDRRCMIEDKWGNTWQIATMRERF